LRRPTVAPNNVGIGERGPVMKKRLTMVYWKGERYWLGKILEHPEIMTQGETVEELEENLKDAYTLLVMDDVPEGYQIKQIAV
jgi:predicted RNase H-like HicB family nuclease